MSKIVIALIIANVLISLQGFNDGSFFEKFKFQVNKILSGEKIRMLSSGFLHADWLHLGFNMFALFMFGVIVDNHLGTFNFILIYFLSLLGGNFYSLQIHKKEPYYSAIGASGAVAGIVFSSILIFPKMPMMIFPIPFEIDAYIIGIGYLLYSIYGMKNQVGNIGHSAHLGGAITGYILTLIFYPEAFTNHKLIVGVMGAIILGLLVFGDKLKLNR